MKVKEATTLAKWSELVKDKVMGPKILAHAKQTLVKNEIDFLHAMTHGDKKKVAYEKYIKNGAPKQVNVDGPLLNQFDAIAKTEDGDWAKAPWEKVINATLADLRGHFAKLDA